MDIGPYLGPVATVAIAILGFYGMVRERRLTRPWLRDTTLAKGSETRRFEA